MGRLEAHARPFLKNLESRLARLEPERRGEVLKGIILRVERPEIVGKAFELFAGLYPDRTVAAGALVQASPGKAAIALKKLGFPAPKIVELSVQGFSLEEAAARAAEVLKAFGKNHLETARELWKKNMKPEHIYSALARHFGPGEGPEALAAIVVGYKRIAEIMKGGQPKPPEEVEAMVSALERAGCPRELAA